MNEKVFSVLVLYNATQTEAEVAVNRLVELGTQVVVCNNSKYDVEINISDCVKVFNFRENLGIAKAQSLGMDWAFNNGADFVLQMDQDSEPDRNLPSKLLECYHELTQNNYSVGLVGCQDYDKDTLEVNEAKVSKGQSVYCSEYISVSSVLSSGSLIPKEVYLQVGGMDDDLFIDAVDFEYCWRIKAAGYLVIKNNKAKLAHKLGDGNKKILLFIDVGVCSPIRHYYQFRNTLLLMKRGYVPIYWKISSLAKLLFKLFIYPFTLPDGYVRFKYMLKGIKDSLMGRVGIVT